jgi:hypothetical protein
MTYARRVDFNHAVVKKAFKQMGCSVADLSRVGDGVPDLLVSILGVNVLVEVKSDGGVLNKKQIEFCKTWKGPLAVVKSVKGAALLVADMGEWARRKSA